MAYRVCVCMAALFALAGAAPGYGDDAKLKAMTAAAGGYRLRFNAGSSLPAPRFAANAVRQNPGFRTNVIPANDDGSGPLTPIGFPVSFFGKTYTHLHVNNNGNFTFDEALSTYTPFPITNTARVIIAPFFADVDTRGDSELVTYGMDTVDGRRAFGANYVRVGYYAIHTDKLNSFQVILIDRSDIAEGDFDIEFNYNSVAWETGDASGGVNGFGGSPARVGYANGTGTPGTFFELPGSAEAGAFLDSNTLTGLSNNSLNSEVRGRYVYTVRSGFVETVDLSISTADTPDPVRAGFELTYIITVRNNGPATAAGVLVRNSLPAGAIFVSARSNTALCRGGTVLVCNIHSLPAGQTATIEVTVIPTGQGDISSGATVLGFQPDSNPENNRVRETTTRVECTGPAVRFLAPSRVLAGSGDFELVIPGICFLPDSIVRFNGVPLGTTVVDPSLIRATVPAALIARPGDVQVTVSAGTRFSAANRFTIVTQPVPSIQSAGVVNAASFTAGAAANSMMTIFGTNLAGETVSAQSLPLPRTLGGVTVWVNSYQAPLFFVSPSQINFLVPFEVLGSAEIAIAVVTPGGVTTNPVVVPLAASAPAIFTVGQDRGAVLIAGANEFAAPAGAIPGRSSRPARRGELISIYATGLGAVNIQPASGTAAPADPLSRIILVPTVNIGGVDVEAEFAGLAPGFAGLTQVNVRVPTNVQPGSAVPLKMSAGEATSNTVTIAVQ